MKGKGKITRTGHEGPEGKQKYRYTLFFNLDTRWGWVVNTTPQPLYPLEMSPYFFYRNFGGPQGRIGPMWKISPPPVMFCFLFVLYFCVFTVLRFCLLSLLYNIHFTNIHAPGGIPTCNPSKRSAADPRLGPLGHWDGIRSADRPARSESMYRLCYSGPPKNPILFP